MDDRLPTIDPDQQTQMASTETSDATDSPIEQASQKYLSSWNHLVSTTNWEKGHIIHQWRQSLRAVDASPSDYSDEAWSRRVGNVTPQHVGRLRRVHKRFHKTHQQYEGLYWSHFQAALDWDDAEMWLEGAVQSGWSVAAMRQARWEALGAPADQKPRDEDVVFAELDEDVSPANDLAAEVAAEDQVVVKEIDDDAAEEDARAERETDSPPDDDESARVSPDDETRMMGEPIRPFEDLPPLPADLHEAVEAMKLAILNHKLAGWKEVRRDDVVAVLGALKQLALAPTDD